MAPVKDRARLKSIISHIVPGGGTNIYAGLETGYEELERVTGPNTANLVILLTDGQVSAGEKDEKKFEALTRKAADRHMETTAIGMGISYNEQLMMAVSRAGGGNYHFLKDGDEAGPIINSEINDLASSLARGVRLRVELPDDVQLVRVLGSEQLSEAQTAAVKQEEKKIDRRVYEELGIQKDRSEQDEPGVKVLIPSFRANDSHVVLLELNVPPGAGSRELARVEVKYKDVPKRKNETLKAVAQAAYAVDRASSVASIQRPVKKNILGFQTGEALMAASRLIDRGDPAAAIRKIDDQLVLIGVAAREWRDRDLERDALMLGQYKDTLVAVHRRGWNQELAAYLGKSFSYSAYQRLK